jgi:tyrosyl-tRNA synthetase
LIVTDFWSEAEAEKAVLEFERVFKEKGLPEEIEEVPITSPSILLLDLIADKKILPSRGEDKRMIRQGGIYLDGQRTDDIAFVLELQPGQETILKLGKKRFYKLKRHE